MCKRLSRGVGFIRGSLKFPRWGCPLMGGGGGGGGLWCVYEALSNSTMVLSLDDGAFPPCDFTLGHNRKCPGMQCVAHGAARAITRTRTYVT